MTDSIYSEGASRKVLLETHQNPMTVWSRIVAKGRHIPTVASARLARELRAQRERAGFNQEAVAEEMGWAESKLYRIENDKSRVLQRDVKRLLKMYGVDGEEADALVELARLAREPDWWHQYSGAIPEWFQVYVVLEASASHVFGYDTELVSGIMQTEAYTRAIMSTAPSPKNEQEIENTITVRTTRQARLFGEDPPEVWLVLNEAVIRRVVGGPTTMRDQLQHLVKLAQLRNVCLQILPFSVGEHGAMHGSFKLLKFEATDDPDRVYMEQQIGGLYTQKTPEVDRYKLMFDHLRAQALGPEQSIAMLRAVATELT
ncbi:helix-turn-helix domain-containing protein [Actinomadura sp. LD22]|uniref:Helix-turn-helix domain-containing protein n=1 Tax=Actinomadura physcomitrii TaxID=2650748 RepID=A0A6I4MH76_9ACTN|nr:helix-turn-helix transcriptional regulator [Actinomadura physcomitrii]MWA01969.1 helix-turn-helix domain-containing protein [Actinomadura physcomitrii]